MVFIFLAYFTLRNNREVYSRGKKKTQVNIIVMNKFTRFLCERLNFVLVIRLWKSPGIFLMKLTGTAQA